MAAERRQAYLSKAKEKCSAEQYQELLGLIDQLNHSRFWKIRTGFSPFILLIRFPFSSAESAVESARTRIPELLHGHRDLILGFNQFLPADAPRIELKKQVQKATAASPAEPVNQLLLCSSAQL